MSTPELDVSLIVVNFHSGEPLQEFFASLERHPIAASHEVVVVDNSPGDGVQPWLAEHAPSARVVDSGSNVGYARAVNAGIEAARGRDVLVINPDVQLEAGSVDRGIEYLRAHPEVGLLGVRLVNADGSDQHNARRFYSLTTILLRRTPYGRLRPDHPDIRRHLMLDDDLSRPGPVDWVTGAFMLVRREALEKVGPMDRRFFLYFEDVDWCQRMWDAGFEVHLVPDVVLRHEHQRSSTRLNQSLWHHVRSFFSYYEKWGALIYVARRFQGMWRRIAAMVSDAVALNLAFAAAFGVRRSLDPFFPEPLFDFAAYLPLLAFANVVSVATLSLMGRYQKPESRHERSGLESLRAAFLVTLVVMAATYLSHTRTFSRAVLLLFVLLYLIALEITRQMGERVLGGSDRESSRLLRLLFVGDPGPLPEGEASAPPTVVAGAVGLRGVDGGLRDLGEWNDLPTVVDRHRVDEVLVPAGQPYDEGLARMLREVGEQGATVLVEDSWAAQPGGTVRRRGGRWWAVWSRSRSRGVERLRRASFDRLVGALLLLVSLPLFVLCWIFGRPFGRTRLQTVRYPASRGAGFAWKELVSTLDDRPLIGLVQAPRYLQVFLGRLSLVGDAPFHSGCQDEDVDEETSPGGDRPGLIRSESTVFHAEGGAHSAASSEVDIFLSNLPSLLWGREPHWSSRK